jgi:hypothetical protein
MRGGTQYIAFRVKKALKRADNLDWFPNFSKKSLLKFLLF